LVDFLVPHRKSARIKVRVGIHTGSVAGKFKYHCLKLLTYLAGVVGITAPRYCLFGKIFCTFIFPTYFQAIL
jgi:hypothetical protein